MIRPLQGWTWSAPTWWRSRRRSILRLTALAGASMMFELLCVLADAAAARKPRQRIAAARAAPAAHRRRRRRQIILSAAGRPAGAACGPAGLPFVPPPMTPLMLIRLGRGRSAAQGVAAARRHRGGLARGRGRGRGQPLLRRTGASTGRRSRRDPRPARRGKAARRQHDRDADREEPVPVARPQAAKSARGWHSPQIELLSQASDHRGLCRHRLVRARRLRRRGGGAKLLRQARPELGPRRGGPSPPPLPARGTS